VGIAQNLTYKMKMKPYMEYWKDILLHLSKPLPPWSATLLKGFWPSSNWRSNYAKASLSTIMDIDNTKDPIWFPYCGPKNMRPLTTYAPFRDLNVGDFMFVKLHDPNHIPLWTRRIDWHTPKLLEKFKCESKGENNKRNN